MEAVELPLIVRKSRQPIIVSLVGSVAVAVFLFFQPDIWSHPLQFGLAFFFSMLAGGCLLILVERKPDLVVSADGIRATCWGTTTVGWDEIDEAFVQSVSGVDYLCFSLRQPEVSLARCHPLIRIASRGNREAGMGDLTLRLSDLGANCANLLQVARQRILLCRSGQVIRPSAVRYRME